MQSLLRTDSTVVQSVSRETTGISRRAAEWMCLGVEDPFVQADVVRRRKYQVEVFQSLGQPKALKTAVSNAREGGGNSEGEQA
jgi:hypothetical protein